MYEDMGLLEDALRNFLIVKNVFKAAEISKKLGRMEDARKYCSEHIERAIKDRERGEKEGMVYGEPKEEHFLGLSKLAREYGLEEKATEFFNRAVESVEDYVPGYALGLYEKNVKDGNLRMDESVRKRLYIKIAREKERLGNFKEAAEFSRMAGLEKQAELYEKIPV